MSVYHDDRAVHPVLDQRLQARALVLALEPTLTAGQAADSLEELAGPTPAAPIAAGRALRRLKAANSYRPTERTGRAIEALGLALARVQARSRNVRAQINKDASMSDSKGDHTR